MSVHCQLSFPQLGKQSLILGISDKNDEQLHFYMHQYLYFNNGDQMLQQFVAVDGDFDYIPLCQMI